MTRLFTATLAAFLWLSASASAATILVTSGSLTGDDWVSGPGGWYDATLTYEVYYDTFTTNYLYQYTFEDLDPNKDISHLITEVSSDFPKSDLELATTPGGVLGVYSGADSSNVGMPAQITGIKWDTGEVTTFSWQIETLNAPVWGNFYAIDGKTPGSEVWIYNTGFDLVGTANQPACYGGLYYDYATCAMVNSTAYAFLLVPDTSGIPPPDVPGAVPEPATLTLLGVGLVVAAGASRRRLARRRN